MGHKYVFSCPPINHTKSLPFGIFQKIIDSHTVSHNPFPIQQKAGCSLQCCCLGSIRIKRMGQQQISVIGAPGASSPRNTRYICSNDLSSGPALPFISGIPSSVLCNDPATKGRMTFSFLPYFVANTTSNFHIC